MSFGHSSAIRFDVNPHAGAPGIFWQKNNPKPEKRKFGYKSKNLRHEIRHPDNTELIEEIEQKKEEEKRKYNKESKDFIQKNKERYKPRDQVPPPGSTHIGPGTVTLTQDQLAALLTSLAALKGDSTSENPLKISFDADTNKIEVHRYESDGESGDDGNDGEKGDERGGKSPALGIYDLIGGDVVSKKSPKPEKREKRTRKTRRDNESETLHLRDESNDKGGLGDSPQNTARSILDEAKKEAGVAHIASNVPLKHMTVGERKRLQWAMERAELEKEYDPWGRPGAGAPMGNKAAEQAKAEKKPPSSHSGEKGSDLKAKHQKQREDLESDIERLRREILEAEKQKEEEEEKIMKSLMKQHKQKKEKDNVAEKGKRNDGGTRRGESKSTTDDEEETVHLSKKEIERRKWVAELNKQREEQRMKKQMERERDKTGVQDQWADRFVYHKTPAQTSPRRGQMKASPREEVSILGKAPESGTVTFDTPAAMRSSMVVGGGTMNETRFDSKKVEEKRQWLEELDRQREEKRQQMAARKERERQEDGIWADRYPTDRHKLNQFAQSNQQPSPRTNVEVETQRVSSAPEPAMANDSSLRTSQEQPTTYLRGQGVYVDPVTRKEQEEKRRLHQEYQAEIKAQIEEKERLKKSERNRKAREDLEEERKFQMERDRVLRHEEAEQKKTKDREAMQQKHLATLKTAMEDAEERAKEEKNIRRIQHLQQRGHDVSHLKATYEAITPRIKEFDTAAIPGLVQSSTSPLPSEQVFVPAHPTTTANTAAGLSTRVPGHHPTDVGQSYAKEPYVEDRVLTPSRHRVPSKPFDNPNSPRREFGTQTLELKDLQSILSSLPDDIQIEYKMKVEEALKGKQENKKPPAPSRKVHSKSADAKNVNAINKRTTAVTRKEQPVERRERVASKERSVKIGGRPQWNQRKVKAVTKNSERDPFYQQKKEESEARKAKRERQLQYLQELNKERIPNLSPTRARASSPDQGAHPGGDRGRGRDTRGRQAKRDASNSNRREGSPNILTLAHDIESKHGNKMTGRSSSPPLPTVKHNTVGRYNYNDDNDPYFYTNSVLRNSQSDGRYDDLTVATAAPVFDGDFIPFTRTTEILDPAKAGDTLTISRENSRMERARKAYHETRQPANRGKHLNVLQDRERESALKSQIAAENNPILNPNLVKDHPTGRQDQILQQLSSLKQNLMQRRKELENYMNPATIET